MRHILHIPQKVIEFASLALAGVWKRVLDQWFNENSPPLGLACCWTKAERNGRGKKFKNLINLIMRRHEWQILKCAWLSRTGFYIRFFGKNSTRWLSIPVFVATRSIHLFKHKLKENDTARSTKTQTNKQKSTTAPTAWCWGPVAGRQSKNAGKPSTSSQS